MRVSTIELEPTDQVSLPMQLSLTGRVRHPINSTLWNGMCFSVEHANSTAWNWQIVIARSASIMNSNAGHLP
jgi:hypothetical protein